MKNNNVVDMVGNVFTVLERQMDEAMDTIKEMDTVKFKLEGFPKTPEYFRDFSSLKEYNKAIANFEKSENSTLLKSKLTKMDAAVKAHFSSILGHMEHANIPYIIGTKYSIIKVVNGKNSDIQYQDYTSYFVGAITQKLVSVGRKDVEIRKGDNEYIIFDTTTNSVLDRDDDLQLLYETFDHWIK